MWQHLFAEQLDLLVPVVAPQLEHHVSAAGLTVLLDRSDAVGGSSRDRLALVEDLVRHPRLRREPSALLHRFGDRLDLLLRQSGKIEQRVGRTLDVLHLVGEVHACDLPRAIAPLVSVGLVDRRHDRAADVDVLADVLARVLNERRCRDGRRQAAVGDLACERLHLRRRRGDVQRRNVPRRLGRILQRRNGRAEGLALVLERSAREHAADDLDGLAHRAERALAVQSRVVEEDLRGAEAEQEPPRSRGLLHDARVHRDLNRVARERRDDPPADGQALRLLRDQAGDDGGRARLHPVLAPPRVCLSEPDRVHSGAIHDARRLEHLLERLHGQLHHTDAERRRHQIDLLTRTAL